MKRGLVMEGGAMRGMFTAGVNDVMMEHGITFDGAIGVSAGAVFGCNFKSGQPGRVIRYNMAYCRDRRYCSLHSLLTTGNLYGEQLCYYEIPDRLDPFDKAAYRENPMEFIAVCTDVTTGKPVYRPCNRWEGESIRFMRASASMPLVSAVVDYMDEDGTVYHLLDGGMADSVPLRAMEERGYDRCVVILTQPTGYVKKPNSLMPLLRLVYRNYPHLLETMERRHEMYNETIAYIEKKERAGEVYVVRPDMPLSVGKVEKNPEKLKECYESGRRACKIEEIRAFLRE